MPGLIGEGSRRGLSYPAIARLLALQPALRYGLFSKGDLAEGYDADIVLVDPDRTWTVRAEDSESTQGYTPFEGLEMTASVRDVFLRGTPILDDGGVVGDPGGRYVHRPTERR